MLRKISLKVKLTLLFLLIGLVPAVIISLITYQSMAQQLREEAFSQLQMFSEKTNQQIGDYIGSKEAEIEVLAVTRDVYQSVNIFREIDGDTSDPLWQERVEILEGLTSIAEEEFEVVSFLITSTDGKAIFCSDETVTVGQEFSGRDYVQGALAGHTVWSEIFYSDITQENAQAVSAPVRSCGSSGEIVGTLSLILNQEIIDRAIHIGIEGLGKTADSYMVDAEGLLMSNTM